MTMEAQEVLERFKSHVAEWKKTVDKYELEDLRKKPDDSNWSLGQVCMHVILVHEKFFMKNAHKCLSGEGKNTRKGKNFMGRMIFFFKSIPPMKVKMPKSHAFEPPQPESKEELNARFDHLIVMMDEVEKKMADADLSIKTKHPLLGMMNVLEWFKGAEMHIRHHFLQRNRVEKFLERGKVY